MNPRRWLFLFLLILTGVRLWIIGQFELFPDEAYYHMWSQRLDWAYFSKGPGVATAIWIGTSLFGHGEFGVRVLSPLLSLGTSLLLFGLAKRIYNEPVAIWTVLGIQCVPIFQAGSLLMTIDPLSIFFWTAALYAFWLAINRGLEISAWWVLTGLMVGLGFLSKYTNAMELFSILLVLVNSSRHRRAFRHGGFYSMLAAFALCAAVPVAWNARHHWITLGHLGSRGGLDRATGLHIGEFASFLGSHFGVYSPLIFAAMLVAIVWAIPRCRISFRKNFLLSFSLPLLLMYFLLSFRQAGEANWTAPATISLAVLTVALWHEKAQQSRWACNFAVAALVIGLGLGLVVTNTDMLRRFGVHWSYGFDPSTRFRGWKTVAERVAEFRAKYEAETGEKVFLVGSNYGLCAELDFYMPEKRAEFPGHPPVYIPESQNIENQFSFWPRYDEYVDTKDVPPNVQRDEYYTEEAGVNLFTGRTALYITDRPENKPPTSMKSGGAFEKSEMVAYWVEKRRGEPLREIRIFACRNYRGMPL